MPNATVLNASFAAKIGALREDFSILTSFAAQIGALWEDLGS